ncbi:MAG: putative outer rane adhesin like protein [Chitinophagaceae bacterium]|nr:putative outer rane adhesin like protein [Chitinophagaceae bacterium]
MKNIIFNWSKIITPSTFTILFILLLQVECKKAKCPLPVTTGNNADNNSPANHAIQLDGTDDYMDISLAPSIYALKTGTISAWIKSPDFNTDHTVFAISKGGTNEDLWYLGTRGAGTLQGTIHTLGLNSSNTSGHATMDAYSPINTFSDAAWHNITIVSDNSGNNIQIYADGVLQSMTAGTCCFGNTLDFFLGDANTAVNATIGVVYETAYTAYGKFTLDDFCIWNRALSASEVQALQSNPSNPPSSGLVLNYTFETFEDLGKGNSGTNDIRDQAGNSHADALNGPVIVIH